MAGAKGLKVDTMRSYLGRARGLGSAKSGFHHWWVQRLTSIALVPLTLWFVFALVSFAGAPYAEVRAWARHHNIAVPDRGRLRPEIWQAWRAAASSESQQHPTGPPPGGCRDDG